jgi:hypothetical protein
VEADPDDDPCAGQRWEFIAGSRLVGELLLVRGRLVLHVAGLWEGEMHSGDALRLLQWASRAGFDADALAAHHRAWELLEGIEDDESAIPWWDFEDGDASSGQLRLDDGRFALLVGERRRAVPMHPDDGPALLAWLKRAEPRMMALAQLEAAFDGMEGGDGL